MEDGHNPAPISTALLKECRESPTWNYYKLWESHDKMERQRRAFRDALIEAVGVIREHHSADGSPQEIWDIYYAHSPEMALIREAMKL